jgi:hypothetical protein
MKNNERYWFLVALILWGIMAYAFLAPRSINYPENVDEYELRDCGSRCH